MGHNTFIIPYLASNLVAVMLLFLCWKKPRPGRIVFSFIFLAAGIFNLYSARTTPEAYTMFAEGAFLPFYKSFINGVFRDHARLLITLIAAGQMIIALLLFTPRRIIQKIGIGGGVLFFLAIAPLGVGSAFPATIIMALALLFSHFRFARTRRS